MAIKHEIKGTVNQMAVCQLDPGQTMYCEAGKFLWKTANVGLETRFTTPDQEEQNKGKGLLGKALSTAVEVGKRQLAGECWRSSTSPRGRLGPGVVRRHAPG